MFERKKYTKIVGHNTQIQSDAPAANYSWNQSTYSSVFLYFHMQN